MEKRLQTTKDYTSENTSTTDCCIYSLPTCSDWSQRRDPALCSVFFYFLSSGVRPQIKIRLRSDPSFFVRLLCFNADQDDSRKKKKKNVNLRLFKTADSRFALSYHLTKWFSLLLGFKLNKISSLRLFFYRLTT